MALVRTLSTLISVGKKFAANALRQLYMTNQDMTTFQAQLILVAVAQRQRLSLVNEALRVRVTTDILLW